MLQAFLNAGIGGRDDTALVAGWDSRPVALFDNEVREVLPSLAAAERGTLSSGLLSLTWK
jgi:hypothetical protein